MLDLHVRDWRLGIVCVPPIDVVLDEVNALVVQPDVVFISKARTHIVREQIRGAPDLVVEVASRATAHYDRGEKLEWYRHYGVRECWLLDPGARVVTVVTLEVHGTAVWQRFSREERVRSTVLPDIAIEAQEFFA